MRLVLNTNVRHHLATLLYVQKQQQRHCALTYMNTESKVCCLSSGTATWMKEEASNPLKIIINSALHWRSPVAVSS